MSQPYNLRYTVPNARNPQQYQMAQTMQQNQIVTPHKLQELVRQIDPSEQLDSEVANV